MADTRSRETSHHGFRGTARGCRSPGGGQWQDLLRVNTSDVDTYSPTSFSLDDHQCLMGGRGTRGVRIQLRLVEL